MTTITRLQQLPTGAWQVDPTHSHVGFEIAYLGGTFRGSFAPVEGTLTVTADGGTLEGAARAEAVHVQDENLTSHLLSPEFFDAERTPELRFRSNTIEQSGNDVTVAGELTIKDVARPVELRGTIGEPVDDAYGRRRAVLTLEGTVDRTEFGLNWNLPLPSGEPALANDVKLTAELFLIQGQ